MEPKKKNPTANIILTDERLNVFPLRSETLQRCSLSPRQFNIILEPLTSEIKQEKKMHTGLKEKIELFHRQCVENPKGIYKKPPRSKK